MGDFNEAELDQSVASTLQHAQLIQRRIDRLLEARDDAMSQVAHRAGLAYTAGEITLGKYAEIYQLARDVIRDGDKRTAAGWSIVWIDARKVNAFLHSQAAGMFDQNESYGWSGPAPLGLAPRPPDGQAVVYVLYADAEPVYVGSTFKFANRIRLHRQDKAFTRWIAYPCRDRGAAYQLEERLLAEHMPGLNRRRGR